MNTIYNKLTVIQSELISGEKVDRQDVFKTEIATCQCP